VECDDLVAWLGVHIRFKGLVCGLMEPSCITASMLFACLVKFVVLGKLN
jgi:hypothetical protein